MHEGDLLHLLTDRVLISHRDSNRSQRSRVVDDHPIRAVARGVAEASIDAAEALTEIAHGSDRARPPVVLVTGSLHLAGAVLAANGQVPV